MSTLRKLIFRIVNRFEQQRCYCSSAAGDKTTVIAQLEVSDKPIYELESEYTAEELEVVCNKSRLYPKHHRMLNGEAPNLLAEDWYQRTEKYKRRMLGRYGLKACDVSPGVAWPSKEDIDDKLEFERVSNPYTIQEGWQILANKAAEENKAIQDRQEYIDMQMSKMVQWRKKLQDKVDKKAAELQAAKEHKEKLLEEVRQHFGFTIDPRDDRFVALMEQKEKEAKKKKKEDKKKKQADEVMQKLFEAEKEMRLKKQSNMDREDKEEEEELKNQKKSGTKQS